MLFPEIIEFALLLLLGGKELASPLVGLLRPLMGEILSEVRRYFSSEEVCMEVMVAISFLSKGKTQADSFLTASNASALNFLSRWSGAMLFFRAATVVVVVFLNEV